MKSVFLSPKVIQLSIGGYSGEQSCLPEVIQLKVTQENIIKTQTLEPGANQF